MAKRYIKEKGLVRAVTTDNLNLEKPLINEHYDIDVHNRNMDKLDSAIKEDKSKISSLESNVNENKKSILDTQTKQGDLSQLKTSNKTNLVNAVNELFQNANDGKSTIANSVGSPLLASDTFSAMGTKINTIKSQLAAAITNKGVSTNATSTFSTFVNNINNISTVQKIVAGESFNLLSPKGSLYVSSDTTSNGYGYELCGATILATGTMRIKYRHTWDIQPINGGTIYILAIRNGVTVVLATAPMVGTNGSYVSGSIDVSVQNNV